MSSPCQDGSIERAEEHDRRHHKRENYDPWTVLQCADGWYRHVLLTNLPIENAPEDCECAEDRSAARIQSVWEIPLTSQGLILCFFTGVFMRPGRTYLGRRMSLTRVGTVTAPFVAKVIVKNAATNSV